MARRVLGHPWPPHPHLRPAVLRVMERTGPYPRVSQGVRARSWILDYEFRNYGRVGVGEPSTVWIPREALSAHLYAPGTCYREDTRRQRGQCHSAWIDFVGAEGIGLERLTAEHGFARFVDQSGLIGDLLRGAAKAACERGHDSYWQVQACLCSAIDLLLRARHVEGDTWRVETAPVRTGPQELVHRAQAIMKEHLAEPVTLGQIARTMHVSVSTLAHLSKAFKPHEGLSPRSSSCDTRPAPDAGGRDNRTGFRASIMYGPARNM